MVDVTGVGSTVDPVTYGFNLLGYTINDFFDNFRR